MILQAERTLGAPASWPLAGGACWREAVPKLAMTQTAIPLQRRLCFAVYSASHAFTRAYRPLLDPLGLTYPQYLVLTILWEQDGLRVKDIGAQLFLDSGTLTPLLKRLEALGYVRRVRDLEDERHVTILLTPQGRELEAKAASIPGDITCLTQLEEEALLDLIERIARLRSNLQQISAVPDPVQI